MTATARTRTGLAAAALALSATGLLGACGSSAGSDASEATTTAAVTTTAPGGETTTTGAGTTTAPDGGETTTTAENNEGVDTETSQLDNLPDGDHYVYMAGLEKGKAEGQDVQVLIVDQVEMLTGQEAIDAAAEDGVTLESDFYIRNSDQTVKRIAVVPEASITSLSGGSADPVPSSVDEVWQQEYLFKINTSTVRDVTLINSVEAVYLP